MQAARTALPSLLCLPACCLLRCLLARLPMTAPMLRPQTVGPPGLCTAIGHLSHQQALGQCKAHAALRRVL